MTHPETVTPPHPALDEPAPPGGPYIIGRVPADDDTAVFIGWDDAAYRLRAYADQQLADARRMVPGQQWRIYQLTDVTDQKGV